tara:strand:- start:463 stop:1041 length:579 start_codon:yes stop_codon:yes gene_type:complete
MTASLSPPLDQNQSSLKAVKQSAELYLISTEGQLKIHTAPYRGSFSGVLSEAMRAAGLGSQVVIAQFLKGGVEQGPNNSTKLCGNLDWLRPDIPCCITNKKNDLDKETASITIKAINEIWEICKTHLFDSNIDQLLLDEIGLAISLGFLDEKEVISTLEQRPNGIDITLTGPSIPPSVMKMADQVTELRSGN